MISLWATCVLAAASPGDAAALAGHPTAIARTPFHFEPGNAVAADLALLDEQIDDVAATAPQPRPFGWADTSHWMVQGAIGGDFHDSTFGKFGLGVSYFIADDFSVDFNLNVLYIDQEDSDAGAVEGNMIMRWHFWRNADRTLSFYADGGAGIFIANEEVPPEGETFNFTPQIGAGVSFNIGERHQRLFIGARWFHVSNANVFTSNPGRDHLEVYAMLSFPF